jgi:hypothetical protein
VAFPAFSILRVAGPPPTARRAGALRLLGVWLYRLFKLKYKKIDFISLSEIKEYIEPFQEVIYDFKEFYQLENAFLPFNRKFPSYKFQEFKIAF